MHCSFVPNTFIWPIEMEPFCDHHQAIKKTLRQSDSIQFNTNKHLSIKNFCFNGNGYFLMIGCFRVCIENIIYSHFYLFFFSWSWKLSLCHKKHLMHGNRYIKLFTLNRLFYNGSSNAAPYLFIIRIFTFYEEASNALVIFLFFLSLRFLFGSIFCLFQHIVTFSTRILLYCEIIIFFILNLSANTLSVYSTIVGIIWCMCSCCCCGLDELFSPATTWNCVQFCCFFNDSGRCCFDWHDNRQYSFIGLSLFSRMRM